jgi:hypothetical protein
MLFYRAALPLSRQTLTFVSGLVRAHRREIGTPWRALNPGQQALLVLVHLRKGEPFAQVGAGFDVSTTTCWRYVNETVELLAARAPKLRAALRKAKREKMAYVIIDGTLIPIDRIAADRPFYSGKHQRHGVNLQVIASPDGTILWVSGQLPGHTHDTAAARIWQILAALNEAGLIALGNKGYHGYDETSQRVITPYKGKNKPQSQRTPTEPTPGSPAPANAPTPSSSSGASCTKPVSAHAASADSPKPSTCYRTTRSPQDEKRSLCRRRQRVDEVCSVN